VQRPGELELPVGPRLHEAVRHGGDLLGEHGDVLVLVVADDQSLDHGELDVREELAREGVQIVDLGAVADPQDPTFGRAGRGGGAGGGLARDGGGAGTATRKDRDDQECDE